MRTPRRSVALRTLGGAGLGLGLLVVFLLSAILGVLLHLGTPRARRIAMTEVNAILAPSFQGQIRIDRIGGLGIFGLTGTDVTVVDPTGRPALAVTGVRARLATFGAIGSALFRSHGPLTVELKSVSVDRLDVRLDTDPSGNLDLLNAFASAQPSAPADPKARGFRLEVDHVRLAHGWAHGQMAGAPPLDVELDGFRGSVTYAPDVLEGAVNEAAIAAHRIANGADVVGSLVAHVKVPSDPKIRPDGDVTWKGAVGAVAESLHASLADDKVDAVLDAPAIAPGDMRTVWADSPVTQIASAHAEAHGTLSHVDVGLHAGLGAAAFDATGVASVGDAKRATLSLEVHGLDAHEFAASAPASSVGLTGSVSADMSAEGALEADVTLAFLGGKVGTSEAPTATIHATASRPDAKHLRADAEIVVDEPGAPTRLVAHLIPKGDSSAVNFDVNAAVPHFEAVPQLNLGVKGNAKVDVWGGLDVATMTVDATLRAHAHDVVQGPNRVRRAEVQGHARGAVKSPQIDVTVRALDVDVAGKHLTSAVVGTTGAATRPHITLSARGPDLPDVEAIGDVGFEDGVSLSGLRVALTRAGEHAVVTVASATANGGDLDVKNARIEGLGEPMTATLALTPRALHVLARTEGLDLGRLGRIAYIEKTLKQGTLALDTDMEMRRDGVQGHVTMDLNQAIAGAVQGIDAHVDVALERRTVTGKVHGEAAGIGAIDLDVKKVVLGGAGPLSVASWRTASGRLDFELQTDLGKLTTLIPPEDLPVSEARGSVTARGHVERDDNGDMSPDVALAAKTIGLVIAAKTPMARHIDGVIVYPPAPWRLAGIDFVIDSSIDGQKGNIQIQTSANDPKGDLVHLGLTMRRFPFADAFNHTERFSTDLRTTPFDLKLEIPERGLGTLPDVLKQSFVSGTMKAVMTAAGTLEAPTLDLTANLLNFHSTGNAMSKPLAVDITAHYDGRHGQVSAKARSADTQLLDVEMQVDAAVASFLDGQGDAPWKASASAHVTGFPLESIGPVEDKLVSGRLNGDVTVADLHEDGHADVNLSVDGLRIGSMAYKGTKIQAKADGKVVDASVRIDQTDGFVAADVHGVAPWGTAIAPALDPAEALTLSLASKNFRITAFLPFLENTFDEFDGRLDGDARVELDPRSRGAHMSGRLALSRGAIEAVAGGGEIHDLVANVALAPDGTITLERIAGAGLTGQFSGNGSAHLDGTTLQSAKGEIEIPSSRPIPLSLGGSELGNVDGKFEVAASSTNAGLDVKVTVPKLRVAVPDGTTTSAEPLGAPSNILIGAHRGSPTTFVILPLDAAKKRDPPPTRDKPATVLSIDTNLVDVEVVRGQMLRVDLEGHLNVKAAEKSHVTGQIHLKPGGMLSVKGKNFTIESGTVTFVGDDPSNPEIVVKAGWTAPDGTTVYANFVGPLKTGKVTLASEPTLPQEEIVELLLFGTTDGQQAQTPSGSTGDTAIGAAGGEAAQPLNHALGQLGLGAVTTNVDTTDSANPKPEVEVQIARDLSIQLAIVLGQPLPGVNPDTVLLSLDWRFMTKWTLSSTLGDAGTTIFDLLWQRRY